jgi:hypothetical protein
MRTNPSLEKLAATLRVEDARVELDDVVFHLRDHAAIPVSFPAAVSMHGRKLRLHLRIPCSATLPPELHQLFERNTSGPITIEREDCHRVTARTEHGLAVELEGVHPRPSESQSSGNLRRYRLDFFRIHTPAEGLDAKDSAEMRQLFAELHARHPETEAPTNLPPAEPHDHLFAIIPDLELLILPHGTQDKRTHPFHGELPSSKLNCFVGKVDGGEFCLESTEDGDLEVSFFRQINAPGALYSADKVFGGILAAIGYTHGSHPWPFYREHRRDHRIIERWLGARDEIRRHGLTPLNKGRLFISKEAQSLFVAVAEFFASDSEAAHLHTRAQWLLREANPKHLAQPLQLMALCILFEGVMNDLSLRLLTEPERKHPKEGGLPRPKKWQSIIERHGLPWVDAFERVYESWDFYRSPLAHGFQERTRDTAGTSFNAYSRLTAALHILLAREAGYTGPLAKSTLEGNEVVVIPTTAVGGNRPADSHE